MAYPTRANLYAPQRRKALAETERGVYSTFPRPTNPKPKPRKEFNQEKENPKSGGRAKPGGIFFRGEAKSWRSTRRARPETEGPTAEPPSGQPKENLV